MKKEVSVAFGIVVSLCTWVMPASAHISLDQSGTHRSRNEDDIATKVAPCGENPGHVAPRTHVYTYAPGESIEISVTEFIPHPSYFRIAFDDDGDDDFVDPRWIVVTDPGTREGGCPRGPADSCRVGDPAMEGDFYNNETVLMDYLEPHGYNTAPREYTWQVTLPDVACDNCTLQIIQVMEDPALGFHGDYNTTDANANNDVYHQCIDLVLERPGGGSPAVSSGDAPAVSSGGSPAVSSGDAPATGCAVATRSGGFRGGVPWSMLLALVYLVQRTFRSGRSRGTRHLQ